MNLFLSIDLNLKLKLTFWTQEFIILQKLLISITLDAKHIKCNLSANVYKHLNGENDTIALRRDMEDIGLIPHLSLHNIPGSTKFIKPKVPYVFTATKNTNFITRVANTRTSIWFSTTLSKPVGEKRLTGLKSHDHHVLFQYIISIAVRQSLLPCTQETIVRLRNLFQQICARVIDPKQSKALLTYATKTLCLLEVWFPPSFFWYYDTSGHSLHGRGRHMLARPVEMVLLGGVLLGCAYKECTRQIKTRGLHGLWILRRRELGIMQQVLRLISPHKMACVGLGRGTKNWKGDFHWKRNFEAT